MFHSFIRPAVSSADKRITFNLEYIFISYFSAGRDLIIIKTWSEPETVVEVKMKLKRLVALGNPKTHFAFMADSQQHCMFVASLTLHLCDISVSVVVSVVRLWSVHALNRWTPGDALLSAPNPSLSFSPSPVCQSPCHVWKCFKVPHSRLLWTGPCQ